MTDDVRDVEAWFDEQLMAYATYDGVEDEVRRRLAVALSEPLDDLTGEDVGHIDAFVKRMLSIFDTDPIDYDTILNGFIRALMAARRGRADLYRFFSNPV